MKLSIPQLDSNLVELVKQTTVEALNKVIEFIKSPTSVDLKGRETAIGLVLISLGAHLYYWHRFSFWSRRNVKTPTPVPIFGNFLSMMFRARQELDLEWSKKYGKVYGIYSGTKPNLVIADAHVLRQICIKDFDKFPNHYFAGVRNKYQKHFLIMQEDNHWRAMRAILTPTFTGKKIKLMHELLHQCASDLVATTISKSQQDSGVINARHLFSPFSLGSALRCFYGIDLNQKSERNDGGGLTKDAFAAKVRNILAISPIRFVLSSVIPLPILEFINFPLVSSGPMEFLAHNAQGIIKHRQNSPVKQVDYLQLLLDAKADEKIEVNDTEKFEDHHALMGDSNTGATNEWRASKTKLTEEEVSCQAMMLIMVATETTSILLSHTVFLLAFHQNIQDTLYEEVMKLGNQRENDGLSNKFDYEQLTSCVYLDCVMSEALRLMPPALFMDRVAKEDYYIEDYGIWVPKGMIVVLSYDAILRCEDYWPEPDKFDPERFKPENKDKIVPGSYCPFGIGPRSCIGFRFALTEAKVALAKLICEFKFTPAPGAVYPPKPKLGGFALNEQMPLLVSVSKR